MPRKSVGTILFGPKLRDAGRPLLEELGKTDRDRLELVIALSTSDKIRVSDCLAALYPSRDEQMATKLLRNFRSVLNQAAQAHSIPLRFEIDTKKQTPAADRFCWFTGASRIDVSAAELSRAGVEDAENATILNRARIDIGPRRQVLVFVCYPRATKARVYDLLAHLRSYWNLSGRFQYEVWLDREIVAGEAWDAKIRQKLAESDVAVLFLSKEFFESDYIWEHELPEIVGPANHKPCVLVAMGQMDHDLLDLRGLDERQIFRHKNRSYLECSTEKLKEEFALELHRQMETYVAAAVAGDPLPVGPDFDGATSLPPDLREFDRDRRRRLIGHRVATSLVSDDIGDANAGPHCFVPNLGYSGRLDALGDKAATIRAQEGGIAAVEYLEKWAADPNEPAFCAVLGEYGVGKTTTIKQLTHRLLAARAAQPAPADHTPAAAAQSRRQFSDPPHKPPSPSSILDPPSSTLPSSTPPSPTSLQHGPPLPIYIDLRSYVHADDSTAERLPKLREILAVILERQPRLAHETTLTPDDILTLVREEGALIIFDGLDEKIVHLTPRQSKWFIRELWGALPSKKQFPNRGKMILSCRSHYFPDVRSQQALLTGEDRDDKTADDYRACLVLPFTEKQIRQYLEHVLGADRVEPAMELFSAVHNLRELAERPYLLSIIVRQIDKLERKRAAGQTVRATDLYAELAESWLHRDDGKHVFSLDEKQRLMEALAAALTKSGEREWPWDRLEKWLVQFLKHDETTAFRHQKDPHELLEQDLRTAAFILRPDTGGPERLNHFRFAHTSLQEYFLACHLSRALRENHPERWDLPAVSVETLDFLGQLLASAGDRIAIETLNQILGADCLAAALLAFKYWLHALAKGGLGAIPNDGPGIAAPFYPLPSPSHLNLPGANLAELRIAGRSPDQPLRLRGANLAGAKLNRVRLQYVDLTGANLTDVEARQALFQDVLAANANLTRADLCGLLWRGGSLAGAKLPNTQLAGVQWIHVDLTKAELPETWPQQATAVTAMPAEWAFATVARSTASARLTLILGHSFGVKACVFSPDGRRILSGSNDNTLKIWDAESGVCLMTLNGHSDEVWACAFSPDGRWILSGSEDETLKVWDAESGINLMTLEGHSGDVKACAFSPDDSRILSGSDDTTLKVWNGEDGVCLTTLDGHSSAVMACAFSPDGRRILSGSGDKTLKVWDAESGINLMTLEGHSGDVSACAFSPDGRRILSGSQDKTLKVWDAKSGACLMTLKGHTSWIMTCVFSPDGRRIVSGSSDDTLKVWDAETGACLMTLKGHSDGVKACAYRPDGRRILSGSHDDTLKVWDAESGVLLLTMEGHSGEVYASELSPDGRRILSGSSNNAVEVWDAASGDCLMTLNGHADWVMACVYSHSGQILSASFDETLKVWDAASGDCLMTLGGHTDWVPTCAFNPNGRQILSGSHDNTLKVWDAETGVCLMTLDGHSNWIHACAFSPDGRRILSGSEDNTLKVWDAETGVCQITLEGHAGHVRACAFSSDGMQILSGSDDKTLKVWDGESGVCLMTLEEHSDWVRACAYSPDGRRILSGSRDNTLKVWDAASGVCIMTLQGHFRDISTCAFSPDSRRILSGSYDNTLKLWDASTGKCLRTTLLLPDDEWATVDFDGNRIVAASPEAWRFLGWRITDPRTARLRILPAEYYGPLPTGREVSSA